MRKALYLAFIAAVALSVGCHITQYPVITDRDGGATYIVNTNGNANIASTYTQAAVGFNDKWFELYSGVDQDFGGNQTLTTYANTQPLAIDYTFIDWLYCTPDKGGCWVAKSNTTPSTPFPTFDYTWNTSCEGSGALSLLIAFSARVGECGRLVGNKLSLMDRIEMLNGMLTPGTIMGIDATLIRFTRTNTRVAVSDVNTGQFLGYVPITGVITGGLDGEGRFISVLTSNMKSTMKSLARMGQGHDFSVDFTFNGVTVPGLSMKVLPDQLLKNANKI